MSFLLGSNQVRSVSVLVAILLVFQPNIASGASPVCLELGGDGRRIRPAFTLFSPDGKWIAARTPDEIVLWDFATKEKVATFKNRHEAEMTDIAFSPDSQRIVCLDGEGRVSLWEGSAGWADAAERVMLSPAVGPDGRQKTAAEKTTGGCIAISPDGTVLAIARKLKRIELVAMDTGKSVGDLESERPVDSIQFADQGKLLLVATGGVAKQNQIVQFWNVETLTAEEPLRTPSPPRARFGVGNLAALSPTEKLLALTMTDRSFFNEVRLFELPSRRWVTLTSHFGPGFWPAFSPDGRLLAVPTHRAPADPAAVLVWDVTARTWRRLDCPPEVAQQNIACFNAKFSPDGHYVAAGLTHPQFAVCIWDLQAPEASTGESGSWSGSSLPAPNCPPSARESSGRSRRRILSVVRYSVATSFTTVRLLTAFPEEIPVMSPNICGQSDSDYARAIARAHPKRNEVVMPDQHWKVDRIEESHLEEFRFPQPEDFDLREASPTRDLAQPGQIASARN